MFPKLIDIWNVVYYFFHDFLNLIECTARLLFIPGIIPFTILGIIGVLVKMKSRRI